MDSYGIGSLCILMGQDPYGIRSLWDKILMDPYGIRSLWILMDPCGINLFASSRNC